MAYENTKVEPEKSQADLKKILKKHGADAFSFSEEPGLIKMQFRKAGLFVQIEVQTDTENPKELRRIWRVIFYNVKSRLEGLEDGLQSFEQAFFADIVNPATGETLFREVQRTGRLALPEAMLALPGESGADR